MRILLLNPNYISKRNWGHQLFKNELGKHHDVVYYGSGYKGFKSNLSVPKILKKFKKPFDIILIYESKYARNFKGLGQIKNIPKVLIQIDYAIGIPNYRGFAKIKTINNLIRQNKPDLIFVTSMSNVNEIKKNFNMDKVFMLPFSVDINVYKNTNSKRIIDSMAVYSTHNHVYPNRKRVQGVIKKMGIRSFTKTVIHNAYIRKLNESKMFIISNNVNKRLSMKYTEAMACGALVLADEPEDLKVQGFKRNEHLIIYNGMNDLKEKIQYYLKNSKERNRIAQNGMKFVRSNHSCAKRVRQFTKIVKRELNI